MALDTRLLADAPLLEEALKAADFYRDLTAGQPGAWLSPRGTPVDLMVPESLAGGVGRRGARIPPHSKHAARRAVGLEAALIDHAPMRIRALAPDDQRAYTGNVAGPAALLVAKLHKLGERRGTPGRLADKDAHDLYRLLVAVPTPELAVTLRRLQRYDLTRATTDQATTYLADLFVAGPDAPGSIMAGRAEEGVGDPAIVAAAVTALADDRWTAVTPVEERNS